MNCLAQQSYTKFEKNIAALKLTSVNENMVEISLFCPAPVCRWVFFATYCTLDVLVQGGSRADSTGSVSPSTPMRGPKPVRPSVLLDAQEAPNCGAFWSVTPVLGSAKNRCSSDTAPDSNHSNDSSGTAPALLPGIGLKLKIPMASDHCL